jgi:hypothetical protein
MKRFIDTLPKHLENRRTKSKEFLTTLGLGANLPSWVLTWYLPGIELQKHLNTANASLLRNDGGIVALINMPLQVELFLVHRYFRLRYHALYYSVYHYPIVRNGSAVLSKNAA